MLDDNVVSEGLTHKTIPIRTYGRRLWFWLWRLWLSFLLLSVGLVLLFRFVPIPVSSIMIERTISDWFDDEPDAQRRYEWVPLKQMSLYMPLAVIASEDQRFADHHGFDFVQMEKAISAHQRGKRLRGASTISQQVAKNLFLWSGRSYLRKILEAWFTVLIELMWDKRRIIEVHLNIVEFGRGVYGAGAAAHVYYKRDVGKLSQAQAALLASVLPNPYRFKVDHPSAYVMQRQTWIVSQMHDIGGLAYIKALP